MTIRNALAAAAALSSLAAFTAAAPAEEIAVKGTNCFIGEEEDLGRVFDPGFTKKGLGVGVGLGLSICFQIIEKHAGRIEAARAPPDTGSTRGRERHGRGTLSADVSFRGTDDRACSSAPAGLRPGVACLRVRPGRRAG